jgi:hypothetical protein
MFGRIGSHVGLLAATLLWAVPTLAERADPQTALDLDGRAVDPLEASATVRATVLIFMRTDCPIANRYAPAIERLRSRFEPAGVRFWLVFVDRAQSAPAIREHLLKYDLHARPLRDARHALVKLTGATITPEAVLYVQVDGRPRLVYRGRIDDRYVDVGRARPQPTKHDLQDALDQVLRGTASGTALITQPIGCIIADLQ